jgi:hypothetical protein
VLVPAVLGPEKREDRELEVVRVACQKRADSLELPVGQTECAMQGRIRRRRQAISLASPADHIVLDLARAEFGFADSALLRGTANRRR